MTQPETAFVEVWARMLCAADVHVHGEDHPTWQQLVGEPGSKIRDDYRKAAAWLLPRMTVAPAGVAPATGQTAEVAKHVTRAIFALKSPPPPGSQHYQSGWDDGLEAAMDAARDALAAVLPASADRADVLREAADLAQAEGDQHYKDRWPTAAQAAWGIAEKLRARASQPAKEA